MSATDDLVRNSERHAQEFAEPQLHAAPTARLAIVACMDARLNPYVLLGLETGEAHVIRNAGGVVTDDVIRSLTISQRELGTQEIVLIHHTRCGLLGFPEQDFKREVEADTGLRPPWAAEGFDDVEADVVQSIARIKASPFIPKKDSVRGFVYEVETGRLREVVPDR
jgi:carbonic anhydrase